MHCSRTLVDSFKMATAVAKRKPESIVPPEESDLLRITPLGAGQEVGRSCHILEFKGKKVMLDCGIHPGMSGMESLTFLDEIDTAEIDLLLVSHFHLDHCGSLPWFLEKTIFKGRVFMTHATKAIYRLIAVPVENISRKFLTVNVSSGCFLCMLLNPYEKD